MIKSITNLVKSVRPKTMSDHNADGLHKPSLDGKENLFTIQVMQRRKELETAYGDKKLALRIYEQIIREAYGQRDRERFILEDLCFETKVIEASGFWQLSTIQAGDIARDPKRWEARAVRKRE